MLCHEDDPGDIIDHHDFRDAIGAHSAVIEQAPVPSRLVSCVNAENMIKGEAFHG